LAVVLKGNDMRDELYALINETHFVAPASAHAHFTDIIPNAAAIAPAGNTFVPDAVINAAASALANPAGVNIAFASDTSGAMNAIDPERIIPQTLAELPALAPGGTNFSVINSNMVFPLADAASASETLLRTPQYSGEANLSRLLARAAGTLSGGSRHGVIVFSVSSWDNALVEQAQTLERQGVTVILIVHEPDNAAAARLRAAHPHSIAYANASELPGLLGQIPLFVPRSFTPFSAAADGSFPDVPQGRSSYYYIRDLSMRSVVSGFPDGNFKPDEPVTVAEFLAMAIRIAGLTHIIPDSGMACDVNWAHDIIQFAIYHGLGDYVNLGDPQADNITNEAAFRILNRLLNYRGGTAWNRVRDSELIAHPERDMDFNDLGDLTVSQGVVQTLWRYGIAVGCNNGNLSPQEILNRYQAATMLFHAATPPGSILDGIRHYVSNLGVGFRTFDLSTGVESDVEANEIGAYAFRIWITEPGHYTFTVSSERPLIPPFHFAPILFETAWDGSRRQFPQIYQMPRQVAGRPGYFQLQHHFEANTLIVIAVAGGMGQEFNLRVDPAVVWPAPTHNFVNRSVFGYRWSRRTENGVFVRDEDGNYIYDLRLHSGVDVPMSVGTPVYAIMDGTVRRAYWVSGGGETVFIEHDNNYRTHYLHLDRNSYLVAVDQRVVAGQQIAYSGRTGAVIGDGHLHFEVRNHNNVPINPINRYHVNEQDRPAHLRRAVNENPFFILVDNDDNIVNLRISASGHPVRNSDNVLLCVDGNPVPYYRYVFNPDFCSPQFWSIVPGYRCPCSR